MARQATAQLMTRNSSSEIVEFGSSVTIRPPGWAQPDFRIVGTDEADYRATGEGRATRFRIGRFPAEPNLVTPEGLAHIHEMVDLAQGQHTAARDAAM